MEKRFFIVNIDILNDDDCVVPSISDEEFMTLAEEQGSVYSEEGFVEAFNFDLWFSTETCFLRIINV